MVLTVLELINKELSSTAVLYKGLWCGVVMCVIWLTDGGRHARDFRVEIVPESTDSRFSEGLTF